MCMVGRWVSLFRGVWVASKRYSGRWSRATIMGDRLMPLLPYHEGSYMCIGSRIRTWIWTLWRSDWVWHQSQLHIRTQKNHIASHECQRVIKWQVLYDLAVSTDNTIDSWIGPIVAVLIYLLMNRRRDLAVESVMIRRCNDDSYLTITDARIVNSGVCRFTQRFYIWLHHLLTWPQIPVTCARQSVRGSQSGHLNRGS